MDGSEARELPGPIAARFVTTAGRVTPPQKFAKFAVLDSPLPACWPSECSVVSIAHIDYEKLRRDLTRAVACICPRWLAGQRDDLVQASMIRVMKVAETRLPGGEGNATLGPSLIIVPDGPLHRLPFEALRSGRDADPLAVRYEVVVAPSATLWRHWRQQVRPVSARGALVFADPALTFTTGGTSLPRDAEFRDGVRLGPLPHARSESRALARYIGSVDALTGPLASEAALKARDLGRYAVLHVAAHAIADDAHPERSAILLAPGSDAEDGLLQAREIDALDLHGRVVVLSACQTSSGMDPQR
jgi:CHAT domain